MRTGQSHRTRKASTAGKNTLLDRDESGLVSADETPDPIDEVVLDTAPGLLRAASHPGVVAWEEIIQQDPAYVGLSKRTVAERLGFGHSNFNDVMSGRLSMTDKFADRLSAALGIDRRVLTGLMRSYQDLVRNWSGSFYGSLTEPLLATATRLDIDDPRLGKMLDIETAQIHDLRLGSARLDAGADAFSRAALLIHVGRLLYDLLGDSPVLHRRWLRANNVGLQAVPLELMCDLKGLTHVVDYLQSSTNP